MTTNDPGREPEPTDAAVLMELARQYDENIAPNWPNRIWDRVEIAADRGREYLSGVRPMPDTPAPEPGEECEHGHLARVCVTCELIAAEARVAELEAALTAAADGLLRVESVSHLCNNCCAYETAHEVRQEWHGFDQVLAAPGKETPDAE